MSFLFNNLPQFFDNFRQNLMIEFRNNALLSKLLSKSCFIPSLPEKILDFSFYYPHFSKYTLPVSTGMKIKRPEFLKLLNIRMIDSVIDKYNEFTNINFLKQKIVPKIFFDLFQYNDFCSSTPLETVDKLKSFRKDILNDVDLKGRTICIKEIRNVIIDEICVKNLQKVVVVSFEITLDIVGWNNTSILAKYKRKTKSYQGKLDFEFDNHRNWSVQKFSFNKL